MKDKRQKYKGKRRTKTEDRRPKNGSTGQGAKGREHAKRETRPPTGGTER